MPAETEQEVKPKPKTKRAATKRAAAKQPEPVEESEPVEVEDEESAPILDPESPTRVDDTDFGDLDETEELWEGGPTIADLREWREEFGKVYITAIDIDEGVVWRTIKRSEYREHVRYIESLQEELSPVDLGMLNEEAMAQRVILYPQYDPEFDDAPAGVPSLISQQVMEASGFVSLDVREV